MLSRTHGQKASPTTFGKELKVFTARIDKQIDHMERRKAYAKINGAVGNYNAHVFVLPNVAWDIETKKFLKTIGLSQNEYTTQIENHDWLAESLNDISLVSCILLDFSKDIWMYIMLDYIKQKSINSEVGSSTMPHKVNPINFENAEGNLEITISLAQAISKKLTSSRLQRDLTDSTVLRNLGVIYSHYYISLTSLIKGMKKIDINRKKINEELDNSWEILAEPIQTVMRYYNIKNSYDILKNATRGRIINREIIHKIINSSDLDKTVKNKLLNLKPSEYIGIAEKNYTKKELAMKYNSTRNSELNKNFDDIIIEGLAPDGGLYMPKNWPKIDLPQILNNKNLKYYELASIILKEFVGDTIAKSDLEEIAQKTYKSFTNEKIAPLINFSDNKYVLELFHGPTFAFKDYPLQMLGNLFQYYLSKKIKI